MAQQTPVSTSDVNRRKLFLGSCMALIATSVAFAVVGAVTVALKREFILTNAEVGWVIGAGLWGFAITQAIFAPLCDRLGFRALLRMAFVGHLAGTALMILAGGFWTLFFGALVIAMANGLVEAACNPLVATLYPEEKSVKLNQFHVWFPGGIVIGSVAAFLLDQLGVGFWQIKLALIGVPTLLYGIMMLFDRFPATENVQAGVSVKEMFKATFLSPLMWLLLFAFAITASTELGPNRWVPAVLGAGLGSFAGVGILALAWINGIMAVMRYNSGRVIGRFAPTLVLLASTVLAIIGLLWLSFSETTLAVFLSATVFAFGVAYFWPTMLGLVAERIPRSGALGLGLMGGLGMAVVGLVATPQMGNIADAYANQRLPEQQTVRLLKQAANTLPKVAGQAEGASSQNVRQAASVAQQALARYEAVEGLPEGTTMNALRAISNASVAISTTGNEQAQRITERAGALLGPANNYGGRISFRYVVPFTCVLLFIFGGLYWRDRRRGGYQAKSLHIGEAEHERSGGELSKAEQEEAQASARATK